MWRRLSNQKEIWVRVESQIRGIVIPHQRFSHLNISHENLLNASHRIDTI